LYVTDTLWPDFNRVELLRAFLDFQKRERRFGGLKPLNGSGARSHRALELIEETAVPSR
jgi:undecaprenyl diphosphate synthase